MSSEFAYQGVLTFPDGTEERLDLEVHGWAEPIRLARANRFALIPFPGVSLPVVAINIPDGAKPVFKSRKFVSSPVGKPPTPERIEQLRNDVDIAQAAGDPFQVQHASQQLADAEGRARMVSVEMRCYAVGFKKGQTEVLTWILPNGSIEVGPDPLLADVILRYLSRGGQL